MNDKYNGRQLQMLVQLLAKAHTRMHAQHGCDNNDDSNYRELIKFTKDAISSFAQLQTTQTTRIVRSRRWNGPDSAVPLSSRQK